MLLDASAVLALLQAEKGADIVLGALGDAYLSVITLAEIVAKLCEKSATIEAATAAVDILGCKLLDFDRSIAIRSGELRKLTIKAGLSLGDRICIATAEHHRLPVMTGDRSWSHVALDVDVILIR